jgi:membrane associated rhomboid family serine protease
MVMPLWDENPFTKPTKPWVTWGIILLNIAVYFVEVAALADNDSAFVAAFALTPNSITQSSLVAGAPADLTLLTYMFLHADIFHLFGNMIFLFVFGDDIEEAMGHVRFLVFYLLCGIAGGLVFIASAPQSPIPLIGASGACSGVIAAYLMLRPCAKIKILLFFIVTRLDAFWVIGFWVLTQLYHLASRPDDDVAYWCHVGGLLAGATLFPLMRKAGVELFECMERNDTQETESSLSPTTFSGVPREPTVR